MICTTLIILGLWFLVSIPLSVLCGKVIRSGREHDGIH